MRCPNLTGSTVAALVVAAACGMAGSAVALPAGQGQLAAAVAPVVQPAAHKPRHWYWADGWWRDGPWTGHRILGVVVTRPGPVFVPWAAERLRRCAAKYRSFDPANGTYVSCGKRRTCP